MPSKKKGGKKRIDPSKYAFAQGYNVPTNSNKPEKISDKQVRKEEYKKRKATAQRKAALEAEKAEVQTKIDEYLKKNSKLIEKLRREYPDLDLAQLYWLGTILEKIGHQSRKLIVVNTELNKIGCDPNYGIGIHLDADPLVFWSRDQVPKSYKSVVLPECLREFVSKRLITGEPEYPEQYHEEQEYKYLVRRNRVLQTYLSDRQSELLRQ